MTVWVRDDYPTMQEAVDVVRDGHHPRRVGTNNEEVVIGGNDFSTPEAFIGKGDLNLTQRET